MRCIWGKQTSKEAKLFFFTSKRKWITESANLSVIAEDVRVDAGMTTIGSSTFDEGRTTLNLITLETFVEIALIINIRLI